MLDFFAKKQYNYIIKYKEVSVILIINKSRKEAEALAAAFRCMGIVARAETPEHACAELSPLYHAILIDEPRKLPDECEYIVKLRS